MALEEFWSLYREYKNAGRRDRINQPLGDLQVQLYFTMGIVRATVAPGPQIAIAEGTKAALSQLAARHNLILEEREDSYILNDGEGGYAARLREGEILFAPEKMEANRGVLEDLVIFYQGHGNR